MLLKKYEKIKYSDLSAKAKETYNFQKASSLLADFGFVTNLLKYDWLGADFLAQHIDGDWLKIQLKGRLTTKPEYEGKDIYIMFEDKDVQQWYLFPHDKLTKYCRENYPDAVYTTQGHSRGRLSAWEKEWLRPYAIDPHTPDYQSTSEQNLNLTRLVNKAYQFANDVTARISKVGAVSFSCEPYFIDFVRKLDGEVRSNISEQRSRNQ